jgi:hypothetical protein
MLEGGGEENMATRHTLDDLWPVLEPPADFGERVLAAFDAGAASQPAVQLSGESAAALQPQPAPSGRLRPRRGLWMLAGSCAGALAAAAVLLAVRAPDQPHSGEGAVSGHLILDIRQTLPIGDRALAVAERGAELAWFVTAGNPRVEQPRGSVFYRVDRGGPFTVSTPVGDVRVTGTCFRVAVGPAGDSGVVVAAVEVLEGSVLLVNARGQLPLSAGERADMSRERAPSRLEVVAPAAAAAATRGPDPHARVRQLERELAEARRSRQPASSISDKYFDLSPDELRALARRCELRYALPRHLTALDAPSVSDSVPLDSEQRAAVLRLMEDQRGQYLAALQELYVEVTGEREIARRLSAKSLQEDLYAKLPSEDLREARERLLDDFAKGSSDHHARPGRTPAERFMRLLASATELFYRKLVDVAGVDTARQIREDATSDAVVTSVGNCRHRRAGTP